MPAERQLECSEKAVCWVPCRGLARARSTVGTWFRLKSSVARLQLAATSVAMATPLESLRPFPASLATGEHYALICCTPLSTSAAVSIGEERERQQISSDAAHGEARPSIARHHRLHPTVDSACTCPHAARWGDLWWSQWWSQWWRTNSVHPASPSALSASSSWRSKGAVASTCASGLMLPPTAQPARLTIRSRPPLPQCPSMIRASSGAGGALRAAQHSGVSARQQPAAAAPTCKVAAVARARRTGWGS